MTVQLSDTDWLAIGSIAGCVTALFTAAMAIAVIVTAFFAKGTLQAARDDSRARSRPVLVAYLERELLSHGTILLIIRNFGPSSATEVSVAFDPPAPGKADVDALPNDDLMKWVYQRFAEPVPVWAPAFSTSNVIRTADDPLKPFEVELTYSGPDGTKYGEKFPQHPDHVLKATSSTPSKTKDPIVLAQQGVGALQALVRTIRTR